MLSVKTTTSYNTATGDDCSCSSYSCSEISSEKTAESVINCNCSKCVCSVCPAKPAKRFIQTTSQVGDTATNKLTNSICNCERCFCAVCPSRKSDSMAKSSQTNKPTADQGTGEGNKCDCSVSKIQSTVKVSTQQIRNKEETQTNICNCNECPNMSSILLKAPITCKCIECKCDPCIDPKVNEEIEIANITDSSDDCQCPDLSQPVVAFKPPTECFCIKCDCDPCIDTKVRTNTEEGDCQCPDLTNPIGDFFKSPTTCFCSPCKCNPCSDPNKTKDGGSSAYNNKCTCDTKGQSCECKFCSDPTKLKEDVLRKPPACICNKCTCNSCADENKKDQIEEQKKNGPVCDNDNCDCSPCIDPNKVKQNIGFEVKQRISCDCLKCICNFCSISDKGKGDQVDPNAQLTVQGKNGNGACRCIICACEDSKKAANTCNCPVCKCDPCNDPNINKLKEEQSKQPTICEGPVCICESCKDPNVKQPTEKQSKVVRNDDACLCDPCVCNSKKTTLIQSCDCPVCTCKPCADPNVKESIKTDNNNKDDRNLICTSPQCTCTNCERKKNINESNQKQNSPATVLPKCHCASCNCDRCLYNEQKKDATGEQSTKDVKSEICICTTCDCPDDKKYADEKCICGACACSKCPFGGEKKPSAATCYCNPCACVDCLTKTLKEAQQSDTNRNKVICDCKPCECVDCIFATKNCQCKKANAPVLEFKCSSLKVPMGPNKVEATAKTDISKFTNPPRTVQSTKNNCMCFDCHRIITNQNFQKFEIPTLLQSPPKAAHKHFELESLFKSIPENFTSQKNKNKHNKKVPLHSEFMFPDDETMEPTKLVGCTPEEIKNFLNKSYEKYYNDMNTGDYSNLDKYKDIVNVIRNSLKKIKNAREQVKDNKPFVKADFIETMSEVGIAFDYLKKSCKPNDKIIKAIAKEIKRYTSSTTFINLLGKPEKENKNNFIPGTRSLAHSHNHPMRVSVPTIPVLQPTMVSTRPSSAVPGQHRLERICGCPVCTESNDDFMYHSGDTRLKSGRNKLVKTRNYESYSNPVGNNLFRVQSPQFSPRESECVFHSVPQSDHSFNHTSNFHQTRMGDSDKRDINDKRGNLEMLNPILVKQASSIGPNTLSDLKVAITTLEAKCRAKDKIIEETAQKLRQHLSSSVLINLMNRIEGIPRYIEVDADTSVAAKKSSKNAQTQIDHLFKDKKGVPCKCGRIHKDNKHVCLNGFRIINIKRITSDSLVIEWKSPRSKAVCGYEIEINGKYKSRIMSGWRTCAMIHSVEMTAPLHVSIYAITSCGRCQPPAKAIYEIKRKEKDVGGKFKNKVNK